MIEYFVLLIFFFWVYYKKWNIIEYLILLKKKFLRILEIAIGNCYKCDLETINDPNNSQYFWINRRDLEIESKLF